MCNKGLYAHFFRLLVLSLAVFFSCFSSAFAQTEAAARTIRVGYVLASGYQEGGPNEYKTGLGYEYLQKISYYTGWSYEYVYGSFNELLEMLKQGEIDIMGNLSFTDERAKFIDYSSHEQGKETYFVLTLDSNDEISESNFTALNGKKVGVNKGSIQHQYFIKWMAENGIDCEIIEYTDKAQREADLNAGIIDATISTQLRANDRNYQNWRAALKFGSSPFYFGVSKKANPDIISDLNAAMDNIFTANQAYAEEVYEKYFSGKLLSSDFMTEDEKDWLDSRQNRVAIAFLDNFLPFSDRNEDGQLTGVLADITVFFTKDFDVTFDCIPFQSYGEMKNALKDGQVDAIFPVYGDYWSAEQQSLFITNTVSSSINTLVYRDSFSSDKTRRIAISDASPYERSYAIIHFPEAELVTYSNTEDSTRAVLHDEVDSTLALRKFYELNHIDLRKLDSLNVYEYADLVDISFGVRDGNTMMLSILDKWLDVIGRKRLDHILIANSNIDQKFSIIDLISENAVTFLLAAFLFTISVIITAVKFVSSTRKQNNQLRMAKEAAETANNQALLAMEKLQHQISLTQRWQEVSETDPLTGLLNRRGAEKRITELIDFQKDGLFCLFDVDGFKKINDRFGHQTGDTALQAVARCLYATFREIDVLSRFGGDEFVIYAVGITNKETAVSRIEKFLAILEKESISEMGDERISVSLGMVIVTEHSDADFKTLYQKADQAMYRSKNDKSERYSFFSESKSS